VEFPASTKIRLLTAPKAPCEICNNAKLNSWFNVKAPQWNMPVWTPANFDMAQADTNAEYIHKVIEEEIALLGGDSTKVMIGGLSQGCMMALYVGLKYEKKLGGVIGINGRMLPDTILSEQNELTPVFITHCTGDNTLKYDISKKTYTDAKYFWAMPQVEFREYKGGQHWPNQTQGQWVREFIETKVECTTDD
jgi:predicted esterase